MAQQFPASGSMMALTINDLGGIDTRSSKIRQDPELFSSLQNMLIVGREIEKRAGSSLYGSAMTGSKVMALGMLDQDSGQTPLAMVNQTLYKYVSGAWTAGDKTNYTANLDTSIVTFTSKSGSSLDNGTTTSGTTPYIVEDTSKTWTPGAYAGKCVVIKGEVKYITDNSAKQLFLADKLNSDTASDYSGQTYNIYDVAPFAFIANGTDYVQKYNLTTTTPIDGTHVSSGMALPKFKYLAVHQGRMWGAGGTGNANDRVFATDIGIGENITTDTNLNVNLQLANDGDEVTAIAPVPVEDGSVLLVTKGSAIYTVEGDNILNYRVHIRNRKVGNIAPKSLAVVGQNAYWLSSVGVISLNTLSGGMLDAPIPISLNIQDQLDTLSSSERAAAVGFVWQNKYFLCAGSLMFYYDIEASVRQQRHVWVNLSFPYTFNCLFEIAGTLYAGSATTGQVYKLFNGTQDDTSNVTGIIETGRVFFGGARVWVERIEFRADEDEDTIPRAQLSVDNGGYDEYIPLTLGQTNSRYVIPVRAMCYDLQVKITEAGTRTPVRFIHPIIIFYSVSEYGDDGTK